MISRPVLLLLLAIVSEVIGTAALKASAGMTRPLPTVLVVVGYISAFYWFALCVRYLPLGLAYAVWSGIGTVGAVAIGVLIWHEELTPLRLLGVALIILGVVVLHLTTPVPVVADQ